MCLRCLTHATESQLLKNWPREGSIFGANNMEWMHGSSMSSLKSVLTLQGCTTHNYANKSLSHWVTHCLLLYMYLMRYHSNKCGNLYSYLNVQTNAHRFFCNRSWETKAYWRAWGGQVKNLVWSTLTEHISQHYFFLQCLGLRNQFYR